jgi:hypothetical protein
MVRNVTSEKPSRALTFDVPDSREERQQMSFPDFVMGMQRERWGLIRSIENGKSDDGEFHDLTEELIILDEVNDTFNKVAQKADKLGFNGGDVAVFLDQGKLVRSSSLANRQLMVRVCKSAYEGMTYDGIIREVSGRQTEVKGELASISVESDEFEKCKKTDDACNRLLLKLRVERAKGVKVR